MGLEPRIESSEVRFSLKRRAASDNEVRLSEVKSSGCLATEIII